MGANNTRELAVMDSTGDSENKAEVEAARATFDAPALMPNAKIKVKVKLKHKVKWVGSKHCWECGRMLQLKKGGGYYFKELKDPLDNTHRLHIVCYKRIDDKYIPDDDPRIASFY